MGAGTLVSGMTEKIKVVGIGAGGHAKILVELLEQVGEYYEMVVFIISQEVLEFYV